MTGRRRGRTGRGWDASPPRPRRDRGSASGATAGRDGNAGGSASRSDQASGPVDRAGRADPVDQAERAREICLRQLAVRPRTRAELATALRRRGIPEDVAAEVLERYGEVGIIDDRAFASAWVASRHHGRGLARRALAVELRRKGLENSIVGEALEELDHETEEHTARALVERKLRTDRGGPPDAVVRRLVGMLARKGYPPGLAFRVVKDALAAAGEADDTDRRDGAQAGLDDSGADSLTALESEYDVDAIEAEARYHDSTSEG